MNVGLPDVMFLVLLVCIVGALYAVASGRLTALIRSPGRQQPKETTLLATTAAGATGLPTQATAPKPYKFGKFYAGVLAAGSVICAVRALQSHEAIYWAVAVVVGLMAYGLWVKRKWVLYLMVAVIGLELLTIAALLLSAWLKGSISDTLANAPATAEALIFVLVILKYYWNRKPDFR